jgi:N-acetylmuramoyl-L-alanine amidase
MATTHTVAQGEYLALIALRHGFHDSRVIWEHPDNAALRQQRKNPNVLLPGDVLAIPDRDASTVNADSGAAHAFTAGEDDPALNLDLEDRSRQPMANRDGTLTLAGTAADGSFVKARPLPQTTDGAGRLQQVFRGPFAERAAATEGAFDMPAQPHAPPASVRLFIGQLDPVDQPSGQRARLNNLGYFAGYTDGDQAQLEWATEEFQCDEKLKDRGLFDDRKKNLPTWNHLGKKHGDLLPGEEIS